MLVHYTRHSNVELNELIQKTPSWHAPPSWNRHEMTRRWYASVFRKPCFDLFKFDAEDSKRTEMLIGLDGCIFSDLPMLAQARSKCYSIYSSHSQELLMFNADARTDTHFLWKACLHGQIPSSSFCLNSSKHTAQICGRKTRTVYRVMKRCCLDTISRRISRELCRTFRLHVGFRRHWCWSAHSSLKMNPSCWDLLCLFLLRTLHSIAVLSTKIVGLFSLLSETESILVITDSKSIRDESANQNLANFKEPEGNTKLV